jgi:hypothetical protein
MTSNTLRNRQIVPSDNELYYKPRVIVDAARDVFGGSIDLDPFFLASVASWRRRRSR